MKPGRRRLARTRTVLLTAAVFAAAIPVGPAVALPAWPPFPSPPLTRAMTSGAVDPLAVPLSGWRLDGLGRSAIVVDRIVYVGGAFSGVISPTGRRVARTNLAAFDLDTGRLLPGFAANTNGVVRALATDGRSLFVGGDFTVVDGRPARRVAALALGTGRVLDWSDPPTVHGAVHALAIADGRLVIGGRFDRVSGLRRRHLAALDPATGRVLTGFTGGTNGPVLALQPFPDRTRLAVGGRFTRVGGEDRVALAVVSATSGRVGEPTFAGIDAPVLAVDVGADGSVVAAGLGGDRNELLVLSTATGRRVTGVATDGDIQAVRVDGGVVWFGFHDGYAGDTALKVLGLNLSTGRLLPFRPRVDGTTGITGITTAGGSLVVTGDFRDVEGTPVAGVAVFPGR